MGITMEEIAEKVSTDKTYGQVYKERSKDDQWMMDILNESYDNLCDKIKIHTQKNEWLPYGEACKAIDCAVFTVAAVYENYIREMRRNGELRST